MISKTHFLLFALCCHALILLGQNDHPAVQLLQRHMTDRPQEKVFVHIDKPFYTLGETVWMSAYLMDAASHSTLTPSSTVYIELLDPDGNIKDINIAKILNGSAPGSFMLDPNWTPGIYTVRAYTKYMLNFGQSWIFQKEIRVASIRDTPESKDPVDSDNKETVLRFYPESGELICGMKMKVGVLSTGENGNGISAKCRIFDSQDNLITLFKTSEEGYGSFVITTDCEQQYYVLIDEQSDIKYPLPEAKAMGLNLSIKNAHKDSMLCVIQSTSDLSNSTLIIHARGSEASIIDGFSGLNAAFYIHHSELKPGINHFTVFEGRVPVAERLVFSNNGSDQYKYITQMQNDQYGQLSSARVDIRPEFFEDVGGTPNISVAITDYYLHSIDQNPLDILSYLLLQSDMEDPINNLARFFGTSEKELRYLDQLLLTKGWRRFNWENIMKDSIQSLVFLPENGFNVSGQVELKKRKKLKLATVQLTALGEGLNVSTQQTDELGYFSFLGLPYQDTTTILLKAVEQQNADEEMKGKEMPILLSNPYEYLNDSMNGYPSMLDLSTETVQNYQEILRYNPQVDSVFANLWTIELEEVNVVGERVDANVEYHEKSMVYSDPDQRLMLDEFPQRFSYTNVVSFLVGKIPGTQVVGSGTNRTFIVRGENTINLDPTVSFLVDGINVPVDYVNTIPVERIAFIDVIRNVSKTVALGVGGSGVIAIYTKTFNDQGERIEESDDDRLNLLLPGYTDIREFYNPLPGETDRLVDLQNRTTLFWSPRVDLGSRHEASITFGTSNQSAIYLIQLQGITPDGKIINTSETFRVN